MKELLTIEQELNAILENGDREILEFKEEVKTAKKNEEEAKKAAIEAKRGDDPEAYVKAIEDKRTASDIAKFYEGKIEEIKDEPYITAAEYKEFTKRIKSEMDSINKQASKRASELLEELEAIQSELMPAYVKTNELLSNLQNNIYKYSADKQFEEARRNKKSVNSNELRNEYKDNSIITSIGYILDSHAAKTIKERGNN